MKRLLRAVIPERFLLHKNLYDVVFICTAAMGHVPSARLRHLYYRRVLG